MSQPTPVVESEYEYLRRAHNMIDNAELSLASMARAHADAESMLRAELAVADGWAKLAVARREAGRM